MALSRRELLTLLLGSSLAAQACRRQPPPRYAGSIRGGANEVGHRIRDATVGRAEGPVHRVKVAVVGAGPSGLSAAWELERQGVDDFEVLELEAQAGGTSCYGSDAVVPYPWAAHYLPLPSPHNRDLVNLLTEMEVVDEASDGELVPRPKMLVREPEERIFYNDEWHEGLVPNQLATAADRREFERFSREIDHWIEWRDSAGQRAFDLPRRRCSSAFEVTALDRISAARWLEQQGYTSPLLRWYLGYACQDDYGCALDTTSAWALLFYFASRVREPGDESAPFLVWPEGNGRLVSHLVSKVGERLKLRQLVANVEPRDSSVELAVLDVATNAVHRLVADYVILALPKFVARRVLTPWRAHPPPFLRAFSYGVWMTANLHLSRRPRSVGFPFAWDNVIFDSPSLGYVVATHQTLRDQGPTVWTYYMPRMAEPKIARTQLEAQDHPSFCDAIVADLARAHEDLAQCIDRIDVWRWGHAMIRPTPGFLWGTERLAAAQPVGRVHFAHSDLSGMALFEEAFDQGLRAAREVAGRLGPMRH